MRSKQAVTVASTVRGLAETQNDIEEQNKAASLEEVSRRLQTHVM